MYINFQYNIKLPGLFKSILLNYTPLEIINHDYSRLKNLLSCALQNTLFLKFRNAFRKK
jgi:hypothetical protein